MKIRKGFVSNSSTSSYVCGVCNGQWAKHDLCISDVEHMMCQHGHIFCEEHLIRTMQRMLFPGMDDEPFDETEEFDTYDVPEANCPVCQFKVLQTPDVGSYYLRDRGVSREQLAEEIKQRFGTYKNFERWLNED
jgi:hypothetical protein